MIFFETINEAADLGKTLLMMALAIVWYGTFGKGGTVDVTESSPRQTHIRLGTFFVCMLMLLSVLAYLLTLAPVLSISLITLAFVTFASFTSILLLLTVFENKGQSYFFSHLGFIIIFVVGGMVVLQYWPW